MQNIDWKLLKKQKETLYNVIHENRHNEMVSGDLDGILYLIDAIQDEFEPKETEEQKTIEFTKVNRDVNGNSRYVCHFLNFITDKDSEIHNFSKNNSSYNTAYKYGLALKRAKQLGGKKFHNKKYGGGIVFQTTNPKEIEQDIIKLLNNIQK